MIDFFAFCGSRVRRVMACVSSCRDDVGFLGLLGGFRALHELRIDFYRDAALPRDHHAILVPLALHLCPHLRRLDVHFHSRHS
jgi:hypothetical protein